MSRQGRENPLLFYVDNVDVIVENLSMLKRGIFGLF